MPSSAFKTERVSSEHPCFSARAARGAGRIHLPVAPECNIQCNFCDRRHDCVNENRPGVTSQILPPGEASAYLNGRLRFRPDISVVGIAGPGDSLCDPQRTLNVIRSVRAAHPGLLLCLSTNGLNLPDCVEDLAEAGVTHVTVTVNAVDPVIGCRIHPWVRAGGKVFRGQEGAELLALRQMEGIAKLKARNIAVKINTVVVPDINSGHVSSIAEKTAFLGADVMNCVPMIPVPGTPFGHLKPMTADEMARVRNEASKYMSQMRHCSQCRADAVGLINQ